MPVCAPFQQMFLADATSTPDVIPTGFQQLKLGAGGWLTGLDHTADGTKLGRSDTNGVYLWDTTALRWNNIVNQTSMAGTGANTGSGAWDAVIAPSNTSIFYMAYDGYMFKSINSGIIWTKQTTFARDANTDYANTGDRRLSGQKIAVDPTNSDHVYAGQTDGGLWRTIDGGTTWAQVSTASVPVGTSAGFRFNPGIAGIVFDPNGGSANGRLNVVYAASYSNGVYKTTNAGTTGTVTWTQIANGTSSPKEVYHAQIDQTTDATYGGAYYCCEKHTNSTFTGWRYHGTTWTQIGTNVSHIAVHPTTPGRIVMFNGENANNGAASTDGGTHSTGIQTLNGGTNVATDIPYLAFTDDRFKSLGDARFDKSTTGANEICVSEGIGWWHTVYPTTDVPYNWNSQSLGLDQLVTNAVVGLPNGNMVFGFSDRPVFTNLNTSTYPSTHGPNDLKSVTGPNATDGTGLLDCRSLARCSGDPTFVAALMNTQANEGSGYSTDGGLTWNYFPLVPSAATFNGSGVPTTIAPPCHGKPIDWDGGTLAVNPADSTNIVWMPGNNGKGLFQTTNRGVSWANVTPTVSAMSGNNTGWGGVFDFVTTSRLVGDEVSADTFYAFWDGDDNTGVGTTHEIFFKSTDKGATWTNVHGQLLVGGQTLIDGKFGVRLRAAPFNAGTLFICSGNLTGGASTLFKTVNGMTTWTVPNTNVSNVSDFCFGYSGTSIPTMYMIGAVSGVQGIYRSPDLGVTWNLLAADGTILPGSSYQTLWTIGASMTTYGLFYIGLASGGGFVQGYFPT